MALLSRSLTTSVVSNPIMKGEYSINLSGDEVEMEPRSSSLVHAGNGGSRAPHVTRLIADTGLLTVHCYEHVSW